GALAVDAVDLDEGFDGVGHGWRLSGVVRAGRGGLVPDPHRRWLHPAIPSTRFWAARADLHPMDGMAATPLGMVGDGP
ncbi:MAG: hypothetical protein L6R48_10680, partial [Planctomycetes bacterium]|nr:hypothetical protein [Planctomycetota bacterium]